MSHVIATDACDPGSVLEMPRMMGLTRSGGTPQDVDEYCEVTMDGAPPLYPHAPQWIFDERIKKQLITKLRLPPMTNMMLQSFTHQRQLDACWRCFTAACDGVDESEPRPVEQWVKDILTPSGWKLASPPQVGSLAVKDFQEMVARAMQSGALSLLPTSGPPRTVQGFCDECGAPCLSECICGEAFCSRTCLRKAWPKHKPLCEQVVDNCQMGCMVSYVEMCSSCVDSNDCDISQALGYSPWQGGLTSTLSSDAPVDVSGLRDSGGSGGPITSSASSAVAGLQCPGCTYLGPASGFSKSQLAKGASARRCKVCIAAKSDMAHEMLKKILEDETASQATRDLVRMRLADDCARPPPVAEDLRAAPFFESPKEASARVAADCTRSNMTKAVVEAWDRASRFDQAEGGVEAVCDAARAVMLDHSKVSFRGERLTSGEVSVRLGHKHLVAAAERLAKDKNATSVQRADAHCFLSVVENMERQLTKAFEHIDAAIRLRPSHAEQLNWRAGLFATQGTFSKAIEDLRAALTCVDGPYAPFHRHSIQGSLGKSLQHLQRDLEARDELEEYVAAAFDGPLAPLLTERDRGHAIVAQYMLVNLAADMGARKAAREHYQQAEKREQALDRVEHARIDWGRKLMAQMWVASETTRIDGANRECHHCHKPFPKLLTCSKCNAAAYCGADCQRAAWKTGHKQACAAMAAAKREERSASKQKAEKHTAQMLRSLSSGVIETPLDALLDPAAIYGAALEQLERGEAAEASWTLLVALFLDWSINSKAKLKPLPRMLRACGGTLPPWAKALEPFCNGGPNLRRFAEAGEALTVRDRADCEIGPAGTLLAGENRADFAQACCFIFDARDLSTAFSQRPERSLAYEAQRLVAEACQVLQPARYLTLMFELAYSNRAIHANEEGTRWSDMMQAAAPKQPNAHWVGFLQRDREGRRCAEMSAKFMGSGGGDHKDLLKMMQQMGGAGAGADGCAQQ